MAIGDVIGNLKHIKCSQDEFKDKVVNSFRNEKHDKIVVGENGKDFFFDKRFDIDYQVTFNPEAEPAIKMKVHKDDGSGTIEVVDAWV